MLDILMYGFVTIGAIAIAFCALVVCYYLAPVFCVGAMMAPLFGYQGGPGFVFGLVGLIALMLASNRRSKRAMNDATSAFSRGAYLGYLVLRR
jgi:hypothetical protein